MLRRLFAKGLLQHNNINRIIPICTNLSFNVNHSNFKSFSTSELNITSKINKVETQIVNVTKKIETIESQLATTTSPSDVYTKDELKDEKKYLLDEKKSLNNQLQSLYERLPKGINIYKHFYFIIYVISSTFLLLNYFYSFL
jgi:hypothetical protein